MTEENNSQSGDQSKHTPYPFSAFAEKYDAWYDSEEGKILYENEKKCIKTLLKGCEKILEIGVGTGRFSVLANQAIGVDIAFPSLKIAKKRGALAIQARAERLPFKDETFECIMFIVTLSFVEDLVKALLEAKRVLKKNGKIIICEIFKESELGKLYEEKKKKGHPFYSYATFYSFSEFKKILENCELKINSAYGTLVNYPCESSRLEAPVKISTETSDFNNFNKIPGFVCIEVSK